MERTEKIIYSTEYRPGTKWNENKDTMYRYMECKICGQMTKCDEGTEALTCSECVQETLANQFGGPETFGKTSSGRPRGWKWMQLYVDKDGTVFHRGIEQPELKGTLPISDIKDRGNKLGKKDKEKIKLEAGSRLFKLKKQYKGLRWKKDKKVFEKNIKYEARILSGKFPRKFNAEEYFEKKY